MDSIEDKINILLGEQKPEKDVLERIQSTLLWDTNQNVPLDYIKDIIENG